MRGKEYGRYGYRRIHALLGNAGWQVNLSEVERIGGGKVSMCRRGNRNGVGSGSATGCATDNAFIETFNSSLRDECLNVHWFETLAEAKRLIEA